MMVLVFSILIIATASLWVEATQRNFDFAALQARQTAMSEAAFAGLEWASRSGAGAERGAGTLTLVGAIVEVTFELRGPPDAQSLEVTSTATGQEQRVTVQATLARVGDLFELDAYVLQRGDR